MIPPNATDPGFAVAGASGGSASRAAPVARPAARNRPSKVPVLVVGGGIAGCSLAYSLARRSLPVALVDRGRLASLGASAVGAALLNPYRGRSGKPGPLDLAGLDAFWRFTSELQAEGLDPGAHRSGVIRIPSNDRQARSWESVPGLTRLDTLPAPYRGPNGAFLVGQGGWVEPHLLIPALVRSAVGRGAEFIEDFSVERVERSGDSWSVHGEKGTLSAGHLVLCLGAGEVDGVPLPELERIAGDQVTLLTSVDLPYPIAGSVYLAGKDGRVWLGGNHRPPGAEDPHAPRLLRASAARLVPPLAEAEVERVWTGVRAKRPDNLPLLEELQPRLWYLGAFGGRGFLTAPLLADRLAERIAEEF